MSDETPQVPSVLLTTIFNPSLMASPSAQSHGYSNPTINLSNLSREDAYLAITAEISRLEDQIRSLRSLYNSLAPVSGLPTELLTKVFMHGCELNESGTFTNLRYDEAICRPKDYHEPTLDVRLVVSWVSRQWRDVVLAYKPIWNLVYATKDKPHPDYIRVCVERCQSLYIDAEGPTPEFLRLCAAYLPQTSYLKLKGPFPEGAHLYPSDFTWPSSAPLLRTLALYEETPYSLFEATNPSMFPQLQSLILDELQMDWESFPPIPLTITRLLIMYPGWPTTTSQLLDLMESMPCLTECWLHECQHIENDVIPNRRRTFPRLQMLDIHSEILSMITFISHVIVPQASLDLSPLECSDQAFDTLIRTLQASHGHVWNSIRRLRLDPDTYLSVSSSIERSSSKHTLSILPFSSAQVLRVLGNLDLGNLYFFWVEKPVIGLMTMISGLTLRAMTLSGRLAVLEAFMDASTPDQHSLPFPALKELTIVDFSDTDSYDWLYPLYDVLDARDTWEIGLQRLVFVDCRDLEMDDLDDILGVVEDVEISRESTRNAYHDENW